MNRRTGLDDDLSAYFQARSTSRAPEGLAKAVQAGVAATRQRPAGLAFARQLPAGLAGRVAPPRRAVAVIALLGLLVALAIALVLAVGSQPRLPPPFGLAKPGLIAFELAGDLYVVASDGSGKRQVTSGPDGDGLPTWSPDGTKIAFESQVADLSREVVATDKDGGHRVVLADHLAEVGDLSWAPDSRRVAFGARLPDTHSSHIFVAEVGRGGAVELGGSDLFGIEPSWSPDGLEIAFKRIDAERSQADYADGTLWLMGADGSNPHQLSPSGGSGNELWNTAWSPDGKRLAFLALGNNQRHDVYVIGSDGKGQRNLTDSPQDEYWPSWSPDGARIAFPRMSLTANNQGTVVVVDPDGSNPVVLPGPPVNSNTLIWSPDGTRILAYEKNPDPSRDANDAIAVFDPTGIVQATTIPAADFSTASWQRLAP
jgi:TolB protein